MRMFEGSCRKVQTIPTAMIPTVTYLVHYVRVLIIACLPISDVRGVRLHVYHIILMMMVVMI